MKILQKAPILILTLYIIAINNNMALGQMTSVTVESSLTEGRASGNSGPRAPILSVVIQVRKTRTDIVL